METPLAPKYQCYVEKRPQDEPETPLLLYLTQLPQELQYALGLLVSLSQHGLGSLGKDV